MRITYKPVNNFHGRPGINLVVGERVVDAMGDYYLISRAQSRRISEHFCGDKQCGCNKGSVFCVDGEHDGILAKYCS